MLKPTFSERTALDIRARIIKWLREHYADHGNWAIHTVPYRQFWYVSPRMRDLAASGAFDDTAESIVLRVLKDMNNFGTVTLQRDIKDSRAAESFIILSERLLSPLTDDVVFDKETHTYVVSDLSVLN